MTSNGELFTAHTRHRPRRRRRLVTAGVAALCAAALAVPALAAPGGNGRGRGNAGTAEASGSCWALDANHVQATGLPTYEQLNLLWTDSTGTDGRALGETGTGDFTIWVETRTETTTYEVISVQKGNDGKVYDVYATCTLEP